MAPPSLSVVCFRYVGSVRDRDVRRLRQSDKKLLERLPLGAEAFLTGSELRGRDVLRACIVNYRSRREDVDRMLDALPAIARDLR